MYNENLKMKRLEEDARSMTNALRAAITPDGVRRDLEPNKKQRRKDMYSDDKGKGNDRSGNPNPRNGVAYEKAQEQLKVKKNMEEMLHEAAQDFMNRKAADPSAKYEDMVRGTALQGIKNYEAMSGPEKAQFAGQMASSGDALADAKVNEDAEEYHKKYDEGARNVPYSEWQKKWTMERQANAAVNPQEEKKIEEEEAKQKERHLHPNVAKDVEELKAAENAAEMNYNMEVAADISEAPSKETIATMKRESIIGAKQLEEDTKIATARLQQVVAHPETYGAKKPLNPGAEVNYKTTEDRAKRQQGKAILKQDETAVLKDAIDLAQSGSKADMQILDEDTKSAVAGNQTMDANDKKEIRREHKFLRSVQKDQGRKASKQMQAGIENGLKRNMKAWHKVEGTVTAGAVGPEYGAAALKSLPTRSRDPQLEAPADYNLNGNSQGAATPLKKDESTNDGADQTPDKSPEGESLSVEEAKMEPAAKKDYSPENKAIAKGMTPDQVAEKEIEEESGGATKEADKIEGATAGKKDDLETIADDAAEGAEKDFAAADDDKALKKEVTEPVMPKAKEEEDDKHGVWDTKESTKEINTGNSASVAKADDKDANEGVTSAGIPY